MVEWRPRERAKLEVPGSIPGGGNNGKDEGGRRKDETDHGGPELPVHGGPAREEACYGALLEERRIVVCRTRLLNVAARFAGGEGSSPSSSAGSQGDGGRSSIGGARGCDPRGCRFKPGRSPVGTKRIGLVGVRVRIAACHAARTGSSPVRGDCGCVAERQTHQTVNLAPFLASQVRVLPHPCERARGPRRAARLQSALVQVRVLSCS